MPGDETVHIIDDDASLRAALETFFRSADIDAVSFASVQGFLDSPHADLRGCLVLDVRLPGTSGLDFQAQLARHGVRVPVILMTGHGDIPMTVRGMKAGALDFLPKPFRNADMLAAVLNAFALDRVRRASEAEHDGLQARWTALSPREQQVMELVTAGRLNKEAAAELALREVTVKVHRAAVMRKMQVGTLADLVKMMEALRARRRTP